MRGSHPTSAGAFLRGGTSVVLLLSTGCLRLPAPEPGMQRTPLTPGSVGVCVGTRCTGTFSVDGERYRVESRLRSMPLREAVEGRRASLGRRVLGSIGRGMLESIDAIIHEDVATVGTLTVRPSRAEGLSLHCRTLEVATEITEGRSGNVRRVPIAEGMRCSATTGDDTAQVRWRFARGAPPEQDSLASWYNDRATSEPLWAPDLPMTLERVGGEEPTAFALAVEGAHTTGGAVRGWRVAVRDGAGTIAWMHLLTTGGASAIDVAARTSGDETEAFRLVAIALLLALAR